MHKSSLYVRILEALRPGVHIELWDCRTEHVHWMLHVDYVASRIFGLISNARSTLRSSQNPNIFGLSCILNWKTPEPSANRRYVLYFVVLQRKIIIVVSKCVLRRVMKYSVQRV